jgi:hypothetical protein
MLNHVDAGVQYRVLDQDHTEKVAAKVLSEVFGHGEVRERGWGGVQHANEEKHNSSAADDLFLARVKDGDEFVQDTKVWM